MVARRSLSTSASERQRLRAELDAARRRTTGHVAQAREQVGLGLKKAARLRWSLPVLAAAGAGLLLATLVGGRRRPKAAGGTAAMEAMRRTLWNVLMRSAARYLEARLLSWGQGGTRPGAGSSLRGEESA